MKKTFRHKGLLVNHYTHKTYHSLEMVIGTYFDPVIDEALPDDSEEYQELKKFLVNLLPVKVNMEDGLVSITAVYSKHGINRLDNIFKLSQLNVLFSFYLLVRSYVIELDPTYLQLFESE